MKKWILEGCVDSVASAVAAAQGGADRLELCANLMIGGTTVRPSVLELVKERVSIPVRTLIRPRFGDFLYSKEEILEMEKDIKMLRKLGADGIVIGMLQKNGDFDTEGMKRLIAAGDGAPVTLHRAFDVCADPKKALEQAIELGIDTVLTSGQKDSCMEGKENLIRLAEQAGDRIAIQCGSGVNAQVIAQMIQESEITYYHMSGKMTLESGMEYRNPEVHMGLKGISEYEIWRADQEAFKAARAVIDAAKLK